MEIILYGNRITLTEENICEGRGKYLVRDATKKSIYQMLKHECMKHNSLESMILKVSDITGGLIVGLTKHMLYILQREGIQSNGKKFLDSIFKNNESFCYKISQLVLQDYKRLGLKDRNDISGATLLLANAAILDLQNLWRGYYNAHGYSGKSELYTLQKFHEARDSMKKITVNTEKSLLTKTVIKALQNAPYDMSLYDKALYLLGNDKNLEVYKNLFVRDFKRGSYRNILSEVKHKEQRKKDVKDVLKRFINDPDVQFESHIYYYGDGTKSESKFSAAINSYAELVGDETPLLCYDATMFGSAEDGLLATTKGIWLHNYLKETKFFSYKEITSLQLIGTFSKDIYINGQEINTAGLPSGYTEKLFTVLSTFRRTFLEMEKTSTPARGSAADLAHRSVMELTTPKMTDKIYNDLLKELDKKYPHKFSDNFYIYSKNTKYQKKFNNAMTEYATLDNDEKPIICYDGTVFGSAKDGFFITTKGLWLHNYNEQSYFWHWNKISSLGLTEGRIFLNGFKFDKIPSKEETNLMFEIIKNLRDRLSKYL